MGWRNTRVIPRRLIWRRCAFTASRPATAGASPRCGRSSATATCGKTDHAPALPDAFPAPPGGGDLGRRHDLRLPLPASRGHGPGAAPAPGRDVGGPGPLLSPGVGVPGLHPGVRYRHAPGGGDAACSRGLARHGAHRAPIAPARFSSGIGANALGGSLTVTPARAGTALIPI